MTLFVKKDGGTSQLHVSRAIHTHCRYLKKVGGKGNAKLQTNHQKEGVKEDEFKNRNP